MFFCFQFTIKKVYKKIHKLHKTLTLTLRVIITIKLDKATLLHSTISAKKKYKLK